MVDEHTTQDFNLKPQEIDRLQQESGEKNLRGRTGGAVTLALGIAKIFDGIPGLRGLMKYWYHFAIMFEALFILTTIDTGTRVARFLLGEFGGRFYRKLEEPNWLPGSILTSAAVVTAWAAFIWGGSISTIWPMFGIANQLLAAVALCVATTVIINLGKARYCWVTIVPLLVRCDDHAGGRLPIYSRHLLAADAKPGDPDPGLHQHFADCADHDSGRDRFDRLSEKMDRRT